MGNLLRKFSLAKWEPNRNLVASQISADAITGCIRTTDNTLSVWSSSTCDFKSDEVEKLIVALATTMDEPAAIDLIWLDDQKLIDKGVELISTPGGSKYKSLNSKHKDICQLKHGTLAIVGEHILEQLNDINTYKRIRKPDLVKLVIKWMEIDREFSVSELHIKWHKHLAKKIEK